MLSLMNMSQSFINIIYLFTTCLIHLVGWLPHFFKTTYRTSDCRGGCCLIYVGSSGNGFVAGFAFPDTDTRSFHCLLTAEAARIFWVLRHLNLLDHLSERGTVSGSVLSNNSYLSCTLGHFDLMWVFLWVSMLNNNNLNIWELTDPGINFYENNLTRYNL